MSDQNPFSYQVPSKPGEPATAASASGGFTSAHAGPASGGPVLRPEPAQRPWSHGQLWLTQAWTLFKAQPGTWLGMMLAFMVAYVVVAIIPFGQLALSLLAPVITAGFVLGAYALDERQGLRFEHLWSGFQHKNVGQLVLVGVLTLVGSLVAVVPALVLVGLGLGWKVVSGGSADAAVVVWVLLGACIAMVLLVPLVMALWFAPALVVLHDMPALEAMKLSLKACWRNIGPFTVYGLLFVGLSIAAVFTLFLAYIVILPLIYISYYTSYRDVLTEG